MRRTERHFIFEGENSFILLERSQPLPGRPSGKVTIKIEMSR